ncbi:helix-turn-helix domain-containing protein [Microbacterium sp.]|uniref:winged helix-turn-helix transcriptional regulator n=1 Tax=Microbacterium sp. TaxID=51671 RepID=UPI002810BDEE|nr:helix-turn-helix domain-containing protein [Microbacterium sp.]
MQPDNLLVTEDCRRAAEVLARIGEKWSVMIFMRLEIEPQRFSELRREIATISSKMLTSTLRGLEREGFVSRTVFPTNPPSVEYQLTDLGREMAEQLRVLATWVLGNLPRIEDARNRFDTVTIDTRRLSAQPTS